MQTGVQQRWSTLQVLFQGLQPLHLRLHTPRQPEHPSYIHTTKMQVHIVQQAIPPAALSAVCRDAHSLADCSNFWLPKVWIERGLVYDMTLLQSSAAAGAATGTSQKDPVPFVDSTPAPLSTTAAAAVVHCCCRHYTSPHTGACSAGPSFLLYTS